MNKHRLTTRPGLSAFLAVALILAGCHTPSKERVKETPTTMQAIERDIVALNAQLDATNSAVTGLFSLRQTNHAKAFETYSRSADLMQKAGDAFLKHADAMASSGAYYLAESPNQRGTYTTAQIRETSSQLRPELIPVFSRIAQSSVGLRGTLQAYLTDIKELKTSLSSDVTPNGVEAMRPTADKAMEDGVELKLQIESILSAVTEAHSHLSPNPAPAAR